MIRKQSKKMSSDLSSLRQIYNEIDNEREPICPGCGCGTNLSHSHLISRKRKEFMCDKRNIALHCQSTPDKVGCHEVWESSSRPTLLDYISNMEYIREVDSQLFREMIVKDYDWINTEGNVCDFKNFSYICIKYEEL